MEGWGQWWLAQFVLKTKNTKCPGPSNVYNAAVAKGPKDCAGNLEYLHMIREFKG
jgi:hypothetical protein